MMKTLKILFAYLRLFVFLVFSFVIALTQLFVGLVFNNYQLIPTLFHKGVCFILNVKVKVTGLDKLSESQKFFVSNHLSWADIFVIGANLEGVFVAKADVSSWPLLGQLSHLQRTIFIQRTRAGVSEGIRLIKQALSRNDNIFLFPEGTNGYKKGEVLPFKSSYYSIFDDEKDLVIQPIAIVPKKVEGKDITKQAEFELYAWGEKEFLPHLISFAGCTSQEIELKILDPIKVGDKQRKQLCEESQQEISKAVM